MNVWLIAAVSADGKIAQSTQQSSLDWTSKEDLRFFVDKTKAAGVVIMGRKTFDTIGKPLKGRRVIVMSTRPHEALEGVEFTAFPPKALLESLSEQGIQTVAIAGGAQIYSQFLREELVTDLFLTIEPVLFGDGVPLATNVDRIDMNLVDVTRLGDQAVLLHYKT